MSVIFEVKCRSCKYEETFPDLLKIAVDDEGKEHNCVHPFESLTIERIEKETGKSYDLLIRMGQIYIGQPLLCNDCGEISYYSDASINILNLHHNNSRITEISCKKCNQNNLYLPFSSSVPPKSLFPYLSHDDRDVRLQWILFLSKVLAWILFVVVIVIAFNLQLIFSIILSMFIILAVPISYIWIEDRIDTHTERKYWKTIPCPQCQKRKLSFRVCGMS
jgi:hypothetical protein